ncbi:MAG: hypothetical protein PHQ27_09735, partial [Victivallales bacterium]|nr:hypothetical protein [Victivallales bacterium]
TPESPDWSQVKPRLARIRTVLRRCPHLGLNRPSPAITTTTETEYKTLCYLLYRYCRWRLLELSRDPAAADATATRELLQDLARCREYELEGNPGSTIYTNRRYLSQCSRILCRRWDLLSDRELRRQQEWWQQQLKTLPQVTRHGVFAAYAEPAEQMGQRFWFMLPYQENIRATAYHLAATATPLLQQDYAVDHEAYRRFVAKQDKIFLLFQPDSDAHYQRIYSATQAICRLTLAGIELEQFYRRHGHYPTAPSLPTDPFSGQPLRYVPGQMLYSVGPERSPAARTASQGDKTNDLIIKLREQP